MNCKLAHDMRNKLGAVIGHCELTLAALPLQDPSFKTLNTVMELCWGMERTIAEYDCAASRRLSNAPIRRQVENGSVNPLTVYAVEHTGD